ncbi:MAG TPA: hypothetical protein PLW75_05560, partial [Hyphomicrobium sp.]|nr:hypothetical protein [Hyphomicrobium sp.]
LAFSFSSPGGDSNVAAFFCRRSGSLFLSVRNMLVLQDKICNIRNERSALLSFMRESVPDTHRGDGAFYASEALHGKQLRMCFRRWTSVVGKLSRLVSGCPPDGAKA